STASRSSTPISEAIAARNVAGEGESPTSDSSEKMLPGESEQMGVESRMTSSDPASTSTMPGLGWPRTAKVSAAFSPTGRTRAPSCSSSSSGTLSSKTALRSIPRRSRTRGSVREGGFPVHRFRGLDATGRCLTLARVGREPANRRSSGTFFAKEETVMAIVRSDPFRDLFNLQDQLFRTFDSAYRGREREEGPMTATWSPLVDVFEDNDGITLKAELPEVDPKDVEIQLEGNTLTLKGERRLENEEKREGYHRIERTYGAFSRTFTLPNTVDVEHIT